MFGVGFSYTVYYVMCSHCIEYVMCHIIEYIMCFHSCTSILHDIQGCSIKLWLCITPVCFMFHVHHIIIYIFTFSIVIIQALFNRAIRCIQARIVLRLMFWVSSSTHHSYNILFNILCILILYHPERRSTSIMFFFWILH